MDLEYMDIPLSYVETRGLPEGREGLLKFFANFDKRYMLLQNCLGYSDIEYYGDNVTANFWNYKVSNSHASRTSISHDLPPEPEEGYDIWSSGIDMSLHDFRYRTATEVNHKKAPSNNIIKMANGASIHMASTDLKIKEVVVFPRCFSRDNVGSFKVGDMVTCLCLLSHIKHKKICGKLKFSKPFLVLNEDNSLSAKAYKDPVRIKRIYNRTGYALVETPLGNRFIFTGFLIHPLHLIPYL